MPKDIVTKLKELKAKTRSKENAIIECKKDIQQGLDAGFSVKEIWLVLNQSGAIPHSYSGFVKAVRKHLGKTFVQNTEPQITPREKPLSVVEIAKPPPPPTPASAKSNTAIRPIEPEQPNSSPVDDDAEDEAEAEARRERSIARYRAQKGKPVQFKSDYTLRMEAKKKIEQERNTQNGENSSDSRE